MDDATEKEIAVAAAESGITENEIENFKIIIEKSKSGDSSVTGLARVVEDGKLKGSVGWQVRKTMC